MNTIIKTHHFGSTLRTLDFSFEATSPREVNPVANKNIQKIVIFSFT